MTTADASIRGELGRVDGYWTPRRLDIWRSMTPEQRDYDRYQGWYPHGAGACETADGALAIEQRQQEAYDDEHACRCHIRPPCWHCTDCRDCTEGEQA